jgi:hypothetical protein
MDADKILANFLEYSYILIIFLIAISGAIYLPKLGAISLCFLAANFFDSNKKVFGRFLISPKNFFRKSILITNYHRAFFFAFLTAFAVNLTMLLLRIADIIQWPT